MDDAPEIPNEPHRAVLRTAGGATALMYRKKFEAAKLRQAHEFDAERDAAQKCGVAAEAAGPGELEQEHRNALARARAKVIAANSAGEQARLSGAGEGKARLYDDLAQCPNRS